MNMAKPMRTWFGGVCAVPNACLVILKTTAIRVKQVSDMIKDGIKVRIPIRNAIFNPANTSPFETSPLLEVLIVINGTPELLAAKTGSKELFKKAPKAARKNIEYKTS